MTLEEIKKAADLAREVEKLEREHQNASRSCFNPQILFASRSSCFQHSSKFIPITKYEVLEIIEKRLASLKTDLNMMGVKT